MTAADTFGIWKLLSVVMILRHKNFGDFPTFSRRNWGSIGSPFMLLEFDLQHESFYLFVSRMVCAENISILYI